MTSENHIGTALPGTRPAGTLDDASAARQVREMFTRIAPHYDLLNHLLSLGFDIRWRNSVAQRFANLIRRPGSRVLDLCCGTGDLALALAKRSRDQRKPSDKPAVRSTQCVQFFGADFARPMLVRAGEKAAAAGVRDVRIDFLEADALRLPFAADSFDLVTTAFGFRNLANYATGLAEIHRVLRPGGTLALLEFAEPQSVFFGAMFRFYFHRVLPKIGGLISSNSQAYGYLPSSVARFPTPAVLAELMRQAGFTEVNFERWTGGIVSLHTARR